MTLGRTEVCDGYLFLVGKPAGDTIKGSYDAVGWGTKKLGILCLHTKHPGKAEGDEPQDQERYHEDRSHDAARAQHLALLPSLLLFPLIVMPLDGEEHTRA